MNADRSPEPRARQARQKSSSPGLFGLTIVLVVLLGVALLYVVTRKPAPVQAQSVEQPVDPFEGLPQEEPPTKQATTKGEAARGAK